MVRTSSPPPEPPQDPLEKRLRAAEELAGFPLSSSRSDLFSRAPAYCQRLLQSSARSRCLKFHQELSRRARASGRAVTDFCPAGLACFAFRAGSKTVVGGFVRLEGKEAPVRLSTAELRSLWEGLAVLSAERLDRQVRAVQELVVSGGAFPPLTPEPEEPVRCLTHARSLFSAAPDLEQLLSDIVQQALRFTRMDAGTLYLVENHRPGRRVSYTPPTSPEARVRTSLLGWREGESRIETEPHPRYATSLFLPLLAGDRTVAHLTLHSRRPRRFRPHEMRLLETFAVLAAIAVENARGFEAEQKRAREATHFYEAARAIGEGHDLEEVLRLSAESLAQTAGARRCRILLAERDRPVLRLAFSLGRGPEPEGRLSEASLDLDELSRETRSHLSHGRPLVLDDASRQDRSLAALLERMETSACLLAPLLNEQEMMGLVILDDPPRGRPFSPSAVWQVMSLSVQVSIALQRAGLIAELQENLRRLETLYDVTTAVTSVLELDRVLAEIVQRVRTVMGADACALRLLEADRLVMKTAEGLDLSRHRDPVSPAHGIHALAVETGSPITLLDREGSAEGEFPRSAREEGFHTLLSIPVQTRGHTVGVVEVYYRELVEITPPQLDLLCALGSQAAVAIENARMYTDKQRVASLLHQVLIPRKELEFPGLRVGHRFIPSMNLSGDYYDLIPLDDHRCAVVIADVSGKGADAAIQTVRVKHVIHSYATTGHSPAEILGMLNQRLFEEELDELRQVTVFYAEVDLAARRLRFACAGHEPPIFKPPRGDPRLLEADGIMIGAVRNPRFDEGTLELPQKAWLVLYTDGITEARSPSGEFFGMDRVMATVRAHRRGSPQRLADRIYRRVRDFSRNRIHDDFSVMAIRF